MYEDLIKCVEEGKVEEVRSVVKKALEEGFSANDVLQKGLMMGMENVGVKFGNDEMFIPEVMRSAKVMHNSLEILRPELLSEDKEISSKGKMVLGTVEGDIHDIGKSLVNMMFVANGFEVIDIGINLSSSYFVEAVREYKPDLVGMSALLTSTMPAIGRTIEAIEGAGLKEDDKLKIIIGGAPVSWEYAKECGADLYADNALEAVKVVKEEFGVK